MKTRTKGLLCGSLAAATYGMNPLFALPLYADGLTAEAILLLRYLFGILSLAVMIRLRGRRFAVERQQVLPLAALGLLMGASSLLLFESYRFMAAGIASTLLFVYPLMVALIMAIVYRERLRLSTWLCIAAALGGILLLYKGADGQTLSGVGTLLVLWSALSYAVYLVWVNRPVFQPIPTIVLSFYVLAFGSLLFVVAALFAPSLPLPSEPWLWGCAAALGLLPSAVSLICTTVSIQTIGSTLTAILGVLEPITALFFGLLLFDEVLTLRDVVGLALILLAVSVVVAGDRLPEMLLRVRKLFPRLHRPARK